MMYFAFKDGSEEPKVGSLYVRRIAFLCCLKHRIFLNYANLLPTKLATLYMLYIKETSSSKRYMSST